MSEGSHAHLPVNAVIDACVGTLHDIESARSDILAAMAERKRRRLWPLPRRSFAQAYEMLSAQEKEISEFHRMHDERITSEIHALAKATAEDNPRFRIHVSTKDFQIIKRHYGKKAA